MSNPFGEDLPHPQGARRLRIVPAARDWDHQVEHNRLPLLGQAIRMSSSPSSGIARMTGSPIVVRPRLIPDIPFPLDAYLPGRSPHPNRDPRRLPSEPSPPPDPADWRACRAYMYGIDLFNHGYYWEAHE